MRPNIYVMLPNIYASLYPTYMIVTQHISPNIYGTYIPKSRFPHDMVDVPHDMVCSTTWLMYPTTYLHDTPHVVEIRRG